MDFNQDKNTISTKGLAPRVALFSLIFLVAFTAVGLSGGTQEANDPSETEKISESEIFNLGEGELAIGTNTIRISRFRLDMGSLPITSLQDPTNAQDAATKAYVDAAGALTSEWFDGVVDGNSGPSSGTNWMTCTIMTCYRVWDGGTQYSCGGSYYSFGYWKIQNDCSDGSCSTDYEIEDGYFLCE